MRSVTSIVLFALVVRAQGKELTANDAQDSMDNFLDEVVSKLFDKMPELLSNVSSFQDADLDSTTLGKPGQLALSQASPSVHLAPGFAQRAPQQAGPSIRANLQARAVPQQILKTPKVAKVDKLGSAANPLKPEVVTPSEVLPSGATQKIIQASAKTATTKDDREAWNLMSVANEALERKQYVAGLMFAVAAAAIIIPEFQAEAAAATAQLNQVLPDTAAAAATVDISAILQKSAQKALGGGSAGASAAVVQVVSLMWLRTAMNYQYRYGGNLQEALKKTY